MDPNQNPPQQPPLPAQPQGPLPAQPQPVPTPQPQPLPPAPQPDYGQPLPAAPLPPQPPQQPQGQYQYPPVQPQAQPASYGQPPADYNPGKKRRPLLKALVAAFGVLIILVIGFVIYSTFLGNKAAAKFGADYITAVQQKDYAKVEELIDPEVQKIGDRLDKVVGPAAKKKLYEQIVETDGIGIGNEEPKMKSVKVSDGGKVKHAFVVYSVGSGTVTVLEIYDASGNLFSLGAQTGKRDLSDEKFDEMYAEYKSALQTYNDDIDAYEDNSNDSSSQDLNSSTKSLDGLFN